jgi:hypothetical protein
MVRKMKSKQCQYMFYILDRLPFEGSHTDANNPTSTLREFIIWRDKASGQDNRRDDADHGERPGDSSRIGTLEEFRERIHSVRALRKILVRLESK